MEIIKVYIFYIARVMEAIGVATIVLGVLIALGRFIFTLQNITPRNYKFLRRELGKGILLGLEILVAQGAASFRRWTGAAAPRTVMRDAAGETA